METILGAAAAAVVVAVDEETDADFVDDCGGGERRLIVTRPVRLTDFLGAATTVSALVVLLRLVEDEVDEVLPEVVTEATASVVACMLLDEAVLPVLLLLVRTWLLSLF